MPLASYSALDKLHMIKAPTLVITGTNDRVVPPDNSDILARGILHSRLVKIAGGSHAFFFEMADVFNREVLHFLLEDPD